jgi:ATP-dependent protease Clp ATPase subunit
MSKYLLYAIGEIILVVIGILIAISINNWNQKRLKHEQLISVYERIVIDIDNDVRQMSRGVAYYDSIEFVFKKVINDSITPDLFDVGLSRILTGTFANITLSTTGVNQLKELDVKDSLSLGVIGIYDFMEHKLVNDYERRINEETSEIVNNFRDSLA